MPRSISKSVPKYRKHRASGQAIVTLSGVDHYLGPHGTKTSKVQYDRLVGEWLQNGRTSAVDDEGSITVVEICVLYWKFAEKHYRKDGRSTRVTPGIKRALSYLKQWYGKEPAESFGPLALKAIRQRMVEEGLSRTYINDHIGRIKRLYRWAAGEELVPPSVPQALSMVAGLRRGRSEARETAPILPVDDSVVEATLEHLP